MLTLLPLLALLLALALVAVTLLLLLLLMLALALLQQDAPQLRKRMKSLKYCHLPMLGQGVF